MPRPLSHAPMSPQGDACALRRIIHRVPLMSPPSVGARQCLALLSHAPMSPQGDACALRRIIHRVPLMSPPSVGARQCLALLSHAPMSPQGEACVAPTKNRLSCDRSKPLALERAPARHAP